MGAAEPTGIAVATMGIALPVMIAVPPIGTAVPAMMGMDDVPGTALAYIMPGGIEPCMGGGTEPTYGAWEPCIGPGKRRT
jgi:hypothetical protein